MGIIALLTAFFTAITELAKSFILIFPEILALIKSWRTHFENIEQRQADAIKEQVNAQLRAQNNQAKKESANQIAFIAGLDSAWATRYEQILELINRGENSTVLVLTDTLDYPPVDDILFFSEDTNENKARKIISIMRKK